MFAVKAELVFVAAHRIEVVTDRRDILWITPFSRVAHAPFGDFERLDQVDGFDGTLAVRADGHWILLDIHGSMGMMTVLNFLAQSRHKTAQSPR